MIDDWCDELEPARVIAAVITRGDQFLLCERSRHKHHGGLWEFPGGKVEAGETSFEAIQRELLEELGVQVIAVGNVEFSTVDPGSGFVIEFVRVSISGNPGCLEHAACCGMVCKSFTAGTSPYPGVTGIGLARTTLRSGSTDFVQRSSMTRDP